MLTRSILKALEKKFSAINDNTKHPYIQSFAIGFAEGLVDGFVIAGAALFVAGIANGVMDAISKKR